MQRRPIGPCARQREVHAQCALAGLRQRSDVRPTIGRAAEAEINQVARHFFDSRAGPVGYEIVVDVDSCRVGAGIIDETGEKQRNCGAGGTRLRIEASAAPHRGAGCTWRRSRGAAALRGYEAGGAGLDGRIQPRRSCDFAGRRRAAAGGEGARRPIGCHWLCAEIVGVTCLRVDTGRLGLAKQEQ